MSDPHLLDVANAIREQTRVLEALVVAVLLDPRRTSPEEDELQRAIDLGKVLVRKNGSVSRGDT